MVQNFKQSPSFIIYQIQIITKTAAYHRQNSCHKVPELLQDYFYDWFRTQYKVTIKILLKNRSFHNQIKSTDLLRSWA